MVSRRKVDRQNVEKRSSHKTSIFPEIDINVIFSELMEAILKCLRQVGEQT